MPVSLAKEPDLSWMNMKPPPRHKKEERHKIKGPFPPSFGTSLISDAI